MNKFPHLPLALGLGALMLTGCSSTPPQNATSNTTENVSQNASTPVANSAAKSGAAKNATTNFTNSPEGLEGALKKNYVDFSFDYPSSWEYKRESGNPNAANFVKVENALHDRVKGDFTLENFAVGYFRSTGNSATDEKMFPMTVKQLSDSFSKAKWSNYRKVSEGPVKINNYSGYQFLFQSRFDKTNSGPVNLWGRVILLPNPKAGKRNGVALTLLATSLQKDLKSAADVGEKGGLPVILKSFKFE